MIEQQRVWVVPRKLKSKTAYDLRWFDESSGAFRSKCVGTDRKRADREAALFEDKLTQGTYKATKRATWRDFVEDHIAKIPGKSNRIEAKRTLNEFGEMCKPSSVKKVSFSLVERYVSELRTRGNSIATINKKLRYLRAAFRKAVRRDYAISNPMDGWAWEREDRKAPRILTKTEEESILAACDSLYGFKWWSFVYVALNTGARRGELQSLTWNRVDFDNARIHITHTKGKRDRYVPVNPDVVDVLKRRQVQTLEQGGPFLDVRNNVNRTWLRIVRKADVVGVTIHDMRRTYVTRLLQSGVRPDEVQKLVGHSSLSTTMGYYAWVSDEDLRAAVKKLTASAG